MKKLIALAIVVVMLVAMAATVLANETVYAAPVDISATNIGDGTISEGEYGRPVAHINSSTAYDEDHDDEEIAGYKGYAWYQGCDPFVQDTLIYVGVSGAKGQYASLAGDRLYIACDQLVPDGKVYGGFNGMAGQDHWCDTAIQFRVSFHDEPTDDVTGNLWESGKDANIIASVYTKEMATGYASDGLVLATWDGLKDGAQFSVIDHTMSDGFALLNTSNCCAGSIGIHGNRLHYELIIRSAYFQNADKTYVNTPEVNDYYLQAGDYFAFSFVSFVAINNDTFHSLLSWGSGIDWPTNQSTMGCTGSNKVVIPTWDEYYVTDDPIAPADTGDALVVVVAAAVMALGTALIVKKVK